jgi:WD40 repeat protein
MLLETSTELPRGPIISFATNRKLEELLGISDHPADDFEVLRDRITDGSCEWILRRHTFMDWIDFENGNSRILWLTGPPAIGKSVLSSFIVDYVQKNISIQDCQYYFFKYEHHTKRTVSQMLRSIAFQVARSNEQFRQRLVELYDTGGLPLDRQRVGRVWETIFEGILFRQNLTRPLVWIIDGLDEADQPEQLVRLLSRIHSANRFRMLIISRMMGDLTSNFSHRIEMVRETVSSDDTLDDIRSYASSVISATLHTDSIREDICNKILAKAHGSFLWITLVLNRLKENWHTQNDIDQMLNDLPEGMETLYVRMVGTISEQAPRPRAIALGILTWVVCSFRPLEMAELEVSLSYEFGEFLSLKDTITQTCGNFVVVEKSRVALIHDTARHFLLHRTDDLPQTIDYRWGNEHIASTCMNFLMDKKKNWRRIFALAQERVPVPASKVQLRRDVVFDNHPFLSYAVTQWAYHVSLASTHSGLLVLVLKFLEQTCLVWINAVALLGDMRTLPRAAQYLNHYIERRNRQSSCEPLVSLSGSRDDELQQWAKDLIRVVGRFGNSLIQNPQSIYKHIIPFCPKQSIIGQTYGQVNTLTVAGISSEIWDDCLARLTVGYDECPMTVLCKGAYFVILIDSGTLVVWHAESCAEARRLHHKERVSLMVCSKISNLVVTAGVKTICVWDVSNGDQVFCLPKIHQRRILALSFGNTDDELIVGYDDSYIQCCELKTSTEKWGFLAEEPGDLEHTCPHLISFSPDICQALIGYRGRPLLAWNLYSPDQPPQKCIHPDDRYSRQQGSWKAGTPECVLWQPELRVVLILYNDTSLVEWNIEDDTQREFSHIGAREMVISPDGSLLLTSDHNGTLSVWTVPELRIMYQLKHDDIVRSLAFSPDGQRFYDIRGTLCNVWEPDALVRPDDLDHEELSRAQDTASSVSSANDAGRAQITALICDSQDKFYCCGKDSGAVVLHEMKMGEKIRKLYGHSSVVSVIEMAWSRSENYIASADDCGRVIAKRLRKPASQNNSWGVYPLLDFRLVEAISQLLFSPSEEYLLVSSSTGDWVWSLMDRKEICQSVNKARTGGKWINYPHDANLLVWIDPGEVRVFNWKSLEEVRSAGLKQVEAVNAESTIASLNYLSLHQTTQGKIPGFIERVTQMDKTKVIFEAFPNTGSNDNSICRRRLTLLDLSASHLQGIRQRPLDGLLGQVNRLIGTYQGRIVFLDHQYFFCTWDIHATGDALKRHFFLPKDWLSPGMLRLCTINMYGAILCPKNGEVAIIRHGIK